MKPDVRAAQNQIATQLMTMIRAKKKPRLPARLQMTLGAQFQRKKLLLLIWHPSSCHTSTTDPCLGCQEPKREIFVDRTQLSGDWGGLRTDLARHGFFFDLYSTSAYQDVASGGLKTGNTSIQNTQLSINVDTGRAGLWSGGIFHVTLESRYGSSSPQNTFTVGSTVPQYTGLAFPGPFFVHDVLPTEYFLLQSLTPKFAVLLGKVNVLTHADQTLFGNSYKYDFANLNFNKNPMALNFYNTTSLAAIGVWTPSQRVTVAAGVFDPNSQANNLATKAFDRVNIYGIANLFIQNRRPARPILGAVQLDEQAEDRFDVTIRAVVPSGVPQAVGVLLGDSFSSGFAHQL